MFRPVSLLALALAAPLAIGCHSSAKATTTPAPVAEVTPPPAVEEEPETEPVVKEEPKNLDIQKDVIRLKRGTHINFQTGSDKLEGSSNETLDEVASVLDQNQRLRIRVEGHTDNTGAADANKDLSTRRAAAVRTYLVSKGIAEDRLESTGCGQDVPVADNGTDDGKAENRRVEFVIMRRKHPREACQLYKPGEHHRRHGETAESK